MKNMQKQLLNSDDRQELIKDAIRNFPGYSIEEIYEKVKSKMSRKTYFRELDILVQRGEVLKEHANKRDRKLYLNTDSPLIIVSKELEDFERNFIELANKTQNKLDLLLLSDSLSNSLHKSIFNNNEEMALTDRIISYYTLLLAIIFHVMESYQFRYILKWSSILKEEDKLQLFKIIFLKLPNILSKFTDITKGIIGPKEYSYYSYIKNIKQLNGANFLMTLQELFYDIKLKKEVDKIINDIWNINRDLCEIVYIEPKNYDFEYDFKKSGYKEFLKKYRPFWIKSFI